MSYCGVQPRVASIPCVQLITFANLLCGLKLIEIPTLIGNWFGGWLFLLKCVISYGTCVLIVLPLVLDYEIYKGVVCTPLCAVCSKEFETAWHSLIVCPRSQKCWEKVGLWPAIHQAIYHVQDPKDLFFRIAGCLDKDKLSQAALIMWNIWISRNSKVWEDTNETHQ